MDDDDPSFDFASFLAQRLGNGETPPDADRINPDERPFAVLAGANKRHFLSCPICLKPPTPTPVPDYPRAFFFRDDASAMEYRISGCCQDCQDALFSDPDGDRDV